MDVTNQILEHHKVYGSSESTNQSYVASGKCFNYSKGNTIQRPIEYEITVLPFKADLKGEVGLFGAENVFFKFNLNAKDSGVICVEEPGWECPIIDQNLQPVNPADEYTFVPTDELGQAFIDFNAPELDQVYISAELSYANYINNFNRFSVYLENKGTDNIYVDSHVDSRLYSIDRQEHPYELMYVATKDCVYVGVHARNTKRLPFDMTVYFGYETIGDETRVPLELQSPCCSATATVNY